MPESFEQQILKWEENIENVLVGITQTKDDRGIPIVVDVMPILNAFNRCIADLRTVRKSHKYRMKPGDIHDAK